ncbi:MAG: hypothetical protein ACXWE7_13290 [Nitrososphaeraceae archaeon]
MTTNSFTFNGNVTATNMHNGDNHYYNSPDDFYKGNSQLEFSDIDKQLVELIYDKTSSEEERLQILYSLKSIKDNETTDLDAKKNYLKSIGDFVTNTGTSLASKLIADLTFIYIKAHS